jgi:hypothetical protein
MPSDDPIRYRCNACGNLTRFDVLSDRRTRTFHHYSVGGDLRVESEEVISEEVLEVSCRWCGRSDSVDRVAPPAVAIDEGLARGGQGASVSG